LLQRGVYPETKVVLRENGVDVQRTTVGALRESVERGLAGAPIR
jgi:hypothetical protein